MELKTMLHVVRKSLEMLLICFILLGLGVLLRGVNAAVLSVFIPVEQRMATLFHDLAGITLPHNYFGNHLDSTRKTIHREMEMKNFQRAAEVLSEV